MEEMKRTKHPLHDVWEKQKQAGEMIAMIYSCAPFTGIVKENEFELIHHLSTEDKLKIKQLEEITDYCTRISEDYFGRREDDCVGVESQKITRY